MDIITQYKEYIINTYPKDSAKGYLYDLNGFMEFLQSRYPNYEQDDFITHSDNVDIIAYLMHLKQTEQNSAATINRKLSSIKKFYAYLADNNYIQKDISKGIKTQKLPENEKAFFTEDECKKILYSVSGRNKIRDTAILMLFLFAGLSVNDVINLKCTDISEDYIYVKQNNKITKKVPQNEALKSILSRYILEVRNYTCENLFSADGINPLGKRTIHQIVVKHLKSAGLYSTGMTSETLRKSGVYLLKKYSDFDYSEIQEYLGLKNASSLKTYENLKEQAHFDKINKNPLSKIKI